MEDPARSVVVNPNLGHPLFIDIDLDLKMDSFQASILFVSNLEEEKEFEELIQNSITLIPILEYRWKLKYLLEKQEDVKIDKKQKRAGFWTRRKKKKRIKDKIEEVFEKKKKKSDDFEQLKQRAFRGDPIFPTIIKVKHVSLTSINSKRYYKDEFNQPISELLKFNVFNNLFNFYKVTIDISLSVEVLEYLKSYNFIMFDIVQNHKDGTERINNHSIIFSKNNWNNITFIHATDLHLAERNDRIYGLIRNWIKLFRMEMTDKYLKKRRKGYQNQVNSEKRSPFHHSLPLNKRLINPNNQLRTFIKLVNKKVLANKLDFIVLTGDIVDFTILSKLPKDVRKLFDFDFEHSNWRIFKEIMLNLPQKKRRGIQENTEILCPIFTIVGNHDFRPYHYDMRWAGLYRKMGLRVEEALALNDKLVALPISSITKSSRALKPYLLEVNPSLDFSMKLGKNNFIFLNSGSDAWRNFRDLIAGHPSVTGLTTKQIKYLEILINNRIEKGDNTFLFLHGPPINPKHKRSIFKRVERKFSKKVRNKIQTKLDEYKESFYKKLGLLEVGARIDGKFNVKYGTVSNNWEKLIKFCKDYTTLTLAGHTHELKEFRLGDPEKNKTRVFDAPPFSLKKVENPASVYYDMYSEFFTSAEEIEAHKPFVVQTPALGLGGYKNPELTGAFREVNIIDGKLSSFKVYFIKR